MSTWNQREGESRPPGGLESRDGQRANCQLTSAAVAPSALSEVRMGSAGGSGSASFGADFLPAEPLPAERGLLPLAWKA